MFGKAKQATGRADSWCGPRAHSREDRRYIARLREPAILWRLGLVVLTAVLATVWIERTGPAVPLRVGEVPGYDVRARVYFEVVNTPHTEWLREESAHLAEPGDLPDPRHALTLAHLPVIERYPPGVTLAKRGQPITDHQIALVREEREAFARSLSRSARNRRAVGLGLVIALLAFVQALYVARFQPALTTGLGKIAGVCGLLLAAMAISTVAAQPPWHAVLWPVTVLGLVLVIATNAPFALLTVFCLAVVNTLASAEELAFFLPQVSGPATAILLLRNVRTRSRLIEVAAAGGLACAAMSVSTGLLTSQTAPYIAGEAGRHFAGCVLAGFVVAGALPLIERASGVLTDVSLIELADSSHPLLQEMVRRAPGTYTHCMTVATLAGPAAEAIQANPLLVRAGCLFHDIGKMLKPDYFVENQNGINRHDRIAPGLSALVIVAHVKDGVALARQYGLPPAVIAFIEQHHGTTLIEYFYREALRYQPQTDPAALEAAFRYPGPKPRTREAAVLMLADAAESASRTLPHPTPANLRKLVRDLATKRLLDGQFADCGLTLGELHRVEESLSAGLAALFHARVKYPEVPVARAS